MAAASEHFATVSYSSPAVVGAFYIPGEVTETSFERDGVAWTAIYRAKHNGLGWLVEEALFTAKLPAVLVEAIVATMRHIGQNKDDSIRAAEPLVASAGAPGLTHSFESLKLRRSHVSTIEQIFTPMLKAMIPPPSPQEVLP